MSFHNLVHISYMYAHTPAHSHMQTAEYLLDHGLLDLVVPRSFLKGALFEMIGFYKVCDGEKLQSTPDCNKGSTWCAVQGREGKALCKLGLGRAAL